MATEQWKQDNQEKMRLYRREWYHRNKSQSMQNVVQRKREIAQWLRQLKSTMSCQECGESRPAALDFHHRDRADKQFEIVSAVNYGWCKQRILDEIAKCDVLCANCHRVLHDNERIALV